MLFVAFISQENAENLVSEKFMNIFLTVLFQRYMNVFDMHQCNIRRHVTHVKVNVCINSSFIVHYFEIVRCEAS